MRREACPSLFFCICAWGMPAGCRHPSLHVASVNCQWLLFLLFEVYVFAFVFGENLAVRLVGRASVDNRLVAVP